MLIIHNANTHKMNLQHDDFQPEVYHSPLRSSLLLRIRTGAMLMVDALKKSSDKMRIIHNNGTIHNNA